MTLINKAKMVIHSFMQAINYHKIKNGRTQAGDFYLFILILFFKLVKKFKFYLIL